MPLHIGTLYTWGFQAKYSPYRSFERRGRQKERNDVELSAASAIMSYGWCSSHCKVFYSHRFRESPSEKTQKDAKQSIWACRVDSVGTVKDLPEIDSASKTKRETQDSEGKETSEKLKIMSVCISLFQV